MVFLVTVGDDARVGVNVLNNALWSVYALLIEVGKEGNTPKYQQQCHSIHVRLYGNMYVILYYIYICIHIYIYVLNIMVLSCHC